MWYEAEPGFDVWAAAGGVVGLLALAVFLWFVYRVGRTFWETVRNATRAVRTEPAELVDRQEQRVRGLLPAPQEERAAPAQGTHYSLTFELEDGERLEFAVPRSDWLGNDIGARGYLTFQGTWYRGFRRMDEQIQRED